MDIEKMISILRAVNAALDKLEVKSGKNNWMQIVGCMNAVDDVAKMLEGMKHDQNCQAEGRN